MKAHSGWVGVGPAEYLVSFPVVQIVEIVGKPQDALHARDHQVERQADVEIILNPIDFGQNLLGPLLALSIGAPDKLERRDSQYDAVQGTALADGHQPVQERIQLGLLGPAVGVCTSVSRGVDEDYVVGKHPTVEGMVRFHQGIEVVAS